MAEEKKKKDDKKAKAFYDWATTGIPVTKAFYDWATTGIPVMNDLARSKDAINIKIHAFVLIF